MEGGLQGVEKAPMKCQPVQGMNSSREHTRTHTHSYDFAIVFIHIFQCSFWVTSNGIVILRRRELDERLPRGEPETAI